MSSTSLVSSANRAESVISSHHASLHTAAALLYAFLHLEQTKQFVLRFRNAQISMQTYLHIALESL